jgi:DNA mismatch endonuclease (patch repair protein)
MDNLTPEQRRKTMQSIRSTGTKAERIIMDELERRGFQFNRYDKVIIGKPDLVFPEKKVAVFVDSDFWHCNPKRFIKPKTNVEYWEKKIERNKERDRKVNLQLKQESWTVVRVWEYDIKHDLNCCVNRILKKLKEKGISTP